MKAELGVIIDGKPGEYGLDQPLIEDPPGDSETPEAGTDIKGVYAKTFLNESGDQELYLVLSTWDNQYNPDATYDFSLRTADTLYHYGFNAWWGSGITDVEQELDGGCKDWFEAKIPLNLLDNPDQIMVDGATGVWPGPGHEGHTADQTLDGTFTIPIMPQIFITDPLNPDTDGDGYSDGGEICVGENPLDPDVTLSYLELVRLSLLGNDDRPDTDGDGLVDCVEEYIGTDSQVVDTDEDGLSDREEFGAIVDGQAGEYGLDQPLTEDPQGDSQSSEVGTDIKGMYAKTFLNENGDEELYLVLSTWDNQFNPDAWYEFRMAVASDSYQYRLEGIRSYLWHCEENDPCVDISDGGVDGQFKDWLEVKIPLDLLGNPDQITVRGVTRAGGDPIHGLDDVDYSSDATFTIAPQLFITDPLNLDTDGDGYSDGEEVQAGTNPLDPESHPWFIYLPLVLKASPLEER